MAREMARLENLEESIRRLSSAERTRAVALAQKETVSVAQVLKVRFVFTRDEGSQYR